MSGAPLGTAPDEQETDARSRRRRARLHEVGEDPDPRFTFANERTFLAWNRTALALIAGGLAVAQFLHLGFRGGRLVVALPLMLLGAGLSIASLWRWQRNERALRLKERLPASKLPGALGYGVAGLAVSGIALAVVEFIVR